MEELSDAGSIPARSTLCSEALQEEGFPGFFMYTFCCFATGRGRYNDEV